MRKGHIPCNDLYPFIPASTALLHLLSGNPLSRLLPRSHPRSPQAPPPARAGAQQFKLFLAKPHPPGEASQGEAAPAPPGAACGKRLKPERPGLCQAGSLQRQAQSGSLGSHLLASRAGAWSPGVVGVSPAPHSSSCSSARPLLALPPPSRPRVRRASQGEHPGAPLLSHLPLDRAPRGWAAALFPGKIWGVGKDPYSTCQASGCFKPGLSRIEMVARPSKSLVGMGP